MKHYKLSGFMSAFLSLVQLCSCQEIEEQNYTIQASVTDESGGPVQGAGVGAGKVEHVPGGPPWQGEPKRLPSFFTDATGSARLSFKSLPQAGNNVSVFKAGFYGYAGALNWEPVADLKDGNWKAEIKAVLKPIRKPIPLYATSMVGEIGRYIRIPESSREYGFDLLLCKPLPPLGEGKTADMFFRLEGTYTTIDQYQLQLKIRFPNEGEGVVEFLTPQRWSMHEPSYTGSVLQSGHEAPEAGYVGTLVRTATKEPGGTRHKGADPQKNFYFRCRTKIGPDGKVESVHYGKIYGDFDFSGGNKEMGFLASFGWSATYFNPTPNDRNADFLDHLFRVLGHDGIKEAGATRETRVAKKGGAKGKNFADLLWPERVLFEMKSRGKKLERQYDQIFDYWTHIVPHRTLDEPGANPLRDAQARLDTAVRAAYAMPKDADILAFLLTLNQTCAAKEAAGHPITPPGLPLPGEEQAGFVTGDCINA